MTMTSDTQLVYRIQEYLGSEATEQDALDAYAMAIPMLGRVLAGMDPDLDWSEAGYDGAFQAAEAICGFSEHDCDPVHTALIAMVENEIG
jgi:hypothetical protein